MQDVPLRIPVVFVFWDRSIEYISLALTGFWFFMATWPVLRRLNCQSPLRKRSASCVA
jgi:hypothetical protein